MITGLSLFEVEEYVSERDPLKEADPANATVFLIGALDVDVQAKIGDRSMVMENTAEGTRFFINQASRNLDAVRAGLRGWRNFKDRDGGDIPFNTVMGNFSGKTILLVSDDSLARLPTWLRNEIGQRVLDANELRTEQEKNLQTP